jgi:hypothetical protein
MELAKAVSKKEAKNSFSYACLSLYREGGRETGKGAVLNGFY